VSAAEPLLVPDTRPMRSSDLDGVMTIEETSFSTPWSRASFRNLMGRGDADLWVATVDGELVGYSVVWYVADESELGNLAVAPEWRRQGLGQWQLDGVLGRAVERGARRIFLEVRVSNVGAHDLYARNGFVQVGIRRRYYRQPVEDARVMCRDLSRPG